MTLNVDKTNALRAWREADTNGKQMLENLYGKEVFENQNIMDRVKTFEDALKETGRPGVPDFSCLPSDMRKYFEAQYKMVVITEALNEGWKPNWGDGDEPKYFPYFWHEDADDEEGVSSGFVFLRTYYGYSYAGAGDGLRLCKILKRQKPCPLAKNNNSKGVVMRSIVEEGSSILPRPS